MTILPNNTKVIERYLNDELSVTDRILFESKLSSDSTLKEDVFYQKQSYHLLKLYRREKLKQEMEALHRKIFDHPSNRSFRKRIQNLFKKT